MSNNTECVTFGAITSIGLPIIYSLMFLLSISGNIMCLVMFKRLSRKKSTHFYLINLSVSNIVVSAGMPFQIVYYSQAHYWPYNSVQCSIGYQGAGILTHCSMWVSTTIFCWIAISRYATLIRHKEQMPVTPKTRYEKIIFAKILKTFRNPRFAFYLCVGVWFTSLSSNMAFFLATRDLAPDKRCVDKELQIVHLTYKITSILESSCFFILFLIVLLFYYFFIKYIQQLQANSCIGEKHLIYSKVKRNIVIIVALLLFCFTPYHLAKFLLVGYEYSKRCHQLSALIEIKNACLCLAEFRSCTDPLVYFCLDDTFKKNFQLFCKKCSKDKEVGSSTSNTQSSIQTPTVSGRIIRSTPTEEYAS